MPANNDPPSTPSTSRNYKLIGQNYTTPDLVAKVTGRAKYAEDYRAEGMLFAKLLLSPMPHAHVRSIDASEALAMPGVKAILTVDDLPAPADAMTDLGQVIPANKLGERGLTNDPVYQGEPILAVCAVDEFTCAEAIEKIQHRLSSVCRTPWIRWSPCGPERPNARVEGNVWVRPDPPPPAKGQPPPPPPAPQVQELKWTEEDFASAKDGQLPMGKATDHWSFGDWEAGLKNARPGSGRNFCHAQHQPPDAGNPHRDGLLAKRQGLRSLLHAEHVADRPGPGALAAYWSRATWW